MTDPRKTPLDCPRAEQLISASIDDELDDAGRQTLDAHLADCADCRATALSWQQQHDLSHSAFTARRASASRVAARVVDRLTPPATSQPVRQRWLPMLLAAAAGFLLAVMIWRPWLERGQVAIPPVAQLGMSIGRVEVLRPGRRMWEVLETDAGLEAGSVVRTGPSGRCELVTSDGALVWMHGDTELRLTDRNALQLTAGRMFGCPKPDAPLAVETSDARVATVDGRFDLQCRPDRQEVVVTAVRGQTDVRAKGQEQAIPGGQSVKIVDGEILQRRPVVDLIKATNWIHEILARKAAGDPELTDRVDAMLASLGRTKMKFLYEDEIRAMGPSCALPLARFIESTGPEEPLSRRRDAARILADIAPTYSVGDLVALLDDADGEVRAQAARGLTRLTGHDHGLPAPQWSSPWSACEPTHQLWLRWWEENKSRYAKRPEASTP